MQDCYIKSNVPIQSFFTDRYLAGNDLLNGAISEVQFPENDSKPCCTLLLKQSHILPSPCPSYSLSWSQPQTRAVFIWLLSGGHLSCYFSNLLSLLSLALSLHTISFLFSSSVILILHPAGRSWTQYLILKPVPDPRSGFMIDLNKGGPTKPKAQFF